MYDDVAPVLTELQKRGLNVGADLELTPQPRRVSRALLAARLDHACRCRRRARLHEAAPQHLRRALERAGVRPDEALMVGDSFKHDIEGALATGMRAVLLRRSGEVPHALPARSAGDHARLTELPAHLLDSR